ncbi:MAG: low specificity L-threonine aldolase [Actinobacteria bacterium]|nr:low specificity L-threonine aldolase [Actinomycetota bacterium]NDB31552.1 low specificity L-threonine aldolase [Actinomycetota bacterium]NDD59789.1 low specificity L-threonine aldolase [Actinomycetota bacterium]NDE50808.1 low specificity L-threonine aldolase [Actinomycetota bacterium]NDF42337.1 low specificity L-threonine aldolase [Actinomycetota bacterium]
MIDLRSDTVTRPSPEMRAAIAAAPVGDDVYGDDPTVNSLEERVAELFGMEAALFTPTGSLANQLAIRMLVAPGEELLCETTSHIARAELGAAAVFSGITTRTWPSERGLLRADDPLAIAHPNAGPYLVSTTAIAIENTHNFGGGTVQSIDEIKRLRSESKKLGISLHLDGARIWNAHVATQVPLKDFGSYVDSISVCLSKGLGAPIGSLMVSTKDRVSRARVWRKRYGGGMRQVGILAAAGHYALDHNIPRLAIDHKHARQLAEACNRIAPQTVNPDTVQTNIVVLDLSDARVSASEFAAQAREKGVSLSALGPTVIRLVTHLDVNQEEIERASSILSELLDRAFVAQ